MKHAGGVHSKNGVGRRGYTLVETTLAMAVTASLFMLTFGLSTMVSNNRFKDTLNSSYVFLRTQYSDVSSGIDSRTGIKSDICETGNIAGNSSNCYSVGRRIYFYMDGNGFTHMASADLIAKTNNGTVWPVSSKSGIENLSSVNLLSSGPDTANGSSNNLTMTQGIIKEIVRSKDGVIDTFSPASSPNRYYDSYIDLMRDPKSAQTVYLGDKNGIQGDAVYAILIENSGSGNYNAGLVCVGGNNAGGLSYNTNIGNGASDTRQLVSLCNNWEAE